MKDPSHSRLLWARAATLVLAALGLAANTPAAAPVAVPAAPIPMFRGNLAHSGVYPGPGPERTPAVKWTFHTDGKIISSPIVAGDTLYIGSTDGQLYALDKDSGKQRWSFATGGRITSSPAISATTVFFESYDSFFYALDRSTGKIRWKFKTAGEHRFAATHLHGHLPEHEVMPDPFDVYLSSPALWNGKVYFGSGDGNVYALDAGTGALRWKYKTGDVVHSSPAIANGTVYIGSWDSYFYALDARGGKLRWRFKTGVDPEYHNGVGIQSSAAVAGGVVYFGCRDNYLYAVNASTGGKLWRVANDGSWVNDSPAVADGKVYYATADTNSVNTLDAKSGANLSSQAIGPWYFFSSPTVAGNMLYAASWDGRLYGIDRSSNAILWTFQTDGSRDNLPRFVRPDGKRRFYLPGSHSFYDDLVSSVNSQFTMGSFLSSPWVADGVLYIGSTDGNLYALQ